MKKLGRKRYYKKGTPLFEAWYANLNSMEGEHLARRQELIGFSRGGDRKSDEFQTATVALRSTAALIISMGIFLITGIGTPFLVFI